MTNLNDQLPNVTEALRRILETHGMAILDDPARLTSLLIDSCPRKVAMLLMTALEDGIPQRIVRSSQGTPLEAQVGILKNRLVKTRGLSDASAEWSVKTWIQALRPDHAPSVDKATLKRDEGSGDSVRIIPDKVDPANPDRTAVMVVLVLVTVLIGGLVVWNLAKGPSYKLADVNFFYSNQASETDAWEPRNFNAWCEPGATFPSDKCASLTPFKASTPFIHARVSAAYTNQRHAEVAMTCSIFDSNNQVIRSVQTQGALPDPRYPKLMRTGWMVSFEQPAGGWKAGRYHVTCTTGTGSVEGWLDVTL